MAHPQSLELKTDSEKTADRYCMLQSQGHCIGFQWGDTTGVERQSVKAESVKFLRANISSA